MVLYTQKISIRFGMDDRMYICIATTNIAYVHMYMYRYIYN